MIKFNTIKSDLSDFCFNEVFNPLFDEVTSYKNNIHYSPPSNIINDKDHYLIEIFAPKLDKSDFNVSIVDNELIVSVNKDSTKDNINYELKEFDYYRKFTRKFRLPKYSLDLNDLSAEYINGVLLLKILKTSNKADPRKVTVK